MKPSRRRSLPLALLFTSSLAFAFLLAAACDKTNPDDFQPLVRPDASADTEDSSPGVDDDASADAGDADAGDARADAADAGPRR